MTAAVLLKARNREMCGVQSVISLLYYSNAEKQVIFVEEASAVVLCIIFGSCIHAGIYMPKSGKGLYVLQTNPFTC